jgi:hypothetical protein
MWTPQIHLKHKFLFQMSLEVNFMKICDCYVLGWMGFDLTVSYKGSCVVSFGSSLVVLRDEGGPFRGSPSRTSQDLLFTLMLASCFPV